MSLKSSEETVASGMLSKRERFGFTMLFAAAVGFGLAPSCAKLAYGAGAEPLTLVAARFGLCLFAIGVMIRIRRTSLTIERGLFVGSLVMGCLLVWNAVGYLSAVKHIPVSLAAALFYTFPVQVGVISAISGTESLSRRRAAALILAFIGVLLSVGFGANIIDWRGVLLALGAGTGVAVSSVLFSRLANVGNSFVLVFWAVLMASLLSSVLMISTAGPQLPNNEIGWLGFTVSMLGFSFALVTYYLVLPLVGAVRAAITANLEPVIAIIVAVAILHEQPNVLQIFGIILILGGVFLVRRGVPRGIT
ncbi:MAG: hypothetical protein CFH37_00924 [Alphaproteobacteria bacterium MarineAlpha9_Bin7]|nr:MAG: hypothetical protein CFH37_00924 [Alphaproteobacteria bacterium MarineAlpha9_Bin7]